MLGTFFQTARYTVLGPGLTIARQTPLVVVVVAMVLNVSSPYSIAWIATRPPVAAGTMIPLSVIACGNVTAPIRCIVTARVAVTSTVPFSVGFVPSWYLYVPALTKTWA